MPDQFPASKPSTRSHWTRDRSLQMIPHLANIGLPLHETPPRAPTEQNYCFKPLNFRSFVTQQQMTGTESKPDSLEHRLSPTFRDSRVLREHGPPLKPHQGLGLCSAVLSGLQTKSGNPPDQPWNPSNLTAELPRTV